MSAVLLTDTPEVADLKRKFRALDELHERVRRWPAGPDRAAELDNITANKKEIARQILLAGVSREWAL